MDTTTANTELARLSDEQVAWRLFQAMSAEFVARSRNGAYWVVAAIEDAVTTESALRATLTSLALAPDSGRLVDANRAGEEEIRRIVESSVVLAGNVATTIRGEPLRPMVDLHYDVPTGIRFQKDRVNRYVFGYRLGPTNGVRKRSYRYRGILRRPGVRWIGQSVLRLPISVAAEVEARLRGWGIPVTREEVFESY